MKSRILPPLAFLAATTAVFGFTKTHQASADPLNTECYRLQIGDDPSTTDEDHKTSQVWCYRHLETPSGATLVFNVDEKGRTSPELSMLVERDGTIVHGSRMSGELTIHRLKSEWSPLPAPLHPPSDAPRVEQPISPSSVGGSDKTLEVFTTSPSEPEDIAIRAEGVITADIDPSLLPWRGYWFPNSSGRLHNGSNSPLAKFDRFVQGRTGRNPGAQRWEKVNHAYTGVNWAGHCNGWAAASIMNKEPQQPWTDPMTGITFGIGDQKGLWIERDYCPKMLFFGHRYNGGGNLSDISALDFHNTVTYYIGKLKKPVLADIRRDMPVENRVFSGYKMTITSVGINTYDINAEMRMHGYDTALTDEIGIAHEEPKTYKYRVWTNATGDVIKAQWQSANPDFIWVPLAPAQCNYQNPAVTEQWMHSIGKPIALPGW